MEDYAAWVQQPQSMTDTAVLKLADELECFLSEVVGKGEAYFEFPALKSFRVADWSVAELEALVHEHNAGVEWKDGDCVGVADTTNVDSDDSTDEDSDDSSVEDSDDSSVEDTDYSTDVESDDSSVEDSDDSTTEESDLTIPEDSDNTTNQGSDLIILKDSDDSANEPSRESKSVNSSSKDSEDSTTGSLDSLLSDLSVEDSGDATLVEHN
jgi:hypothetical protein